MWQRLLDWLGFGSSSQKATTLADKVREAEERADAAEVAAKLRKRLATANQRTRVAGGPAKRGLSFWIAIVVLVIFLLLFLRTCM